MSIIENKIAIKHKEQISLYAKAGKNIQFLNNSSGRIGGSNSAINKLLSHTTELRLIMPNIIGLDPADVLWGDKVHRYMHSISVPVPRTGLDLDASLNYDVLDPSRKENIAILSKELGVKIDSNEALIDACTKSTVHKGIVDEITVLKYASPINASDYFVYIYVLNYSPVANSVADVNKSPNIRFYIYKESVEKEHRETLARLRTKVAVSYSKIADNPTKLGYLYDLYKEDDIMNGSEIGIKVDTTTIIISLSDYIMYEPKKVLSCLDDKQFNKKGEILQMIRAGILSVVPNTTIVLDVNGDELGKTLNSAIKAYYEKDDKFKTAHKAAIKSFMVAQ